MPQGFVSEMDPERLGLFSISGAVEQFFEKWVHVLFVSWFHSLDLL